MRILIVASIVIIGVVVAWRRSRSGPHWTSLAELGRLRVGQEWRFRGRPQDPDPHLIIGRLEVDQTGRELVHVSVRGVRVVNPHHASGYVSEIGHLPLTRAAIDASVTELVAQGVPTPDLAEGYADWRSARGGAFTASVAEAVEFAERAITGNR